MQYSIRLRRYVLIAGMFLLSLLAFTGSLDKLIHHCGMRFVTNYNVTYLDTSFEKSIKGFMILSTIKSGLAVIEGSGVGVGFNLEIGDIVQSLYDYIDIAWKAALAGCSLLFAMKILLQTLSATGHFVLGALFVLWGLYFLLALYLPSVTILSRGVKSSVRSLGFLSLILYLILPASIAGTALLSRHISRPLVEEASQGFDSVQRTFSTDTLSEKIFGTPAEASVLDRLLMIRQYAQTKARLLETYTWLKQQMRHVAVWTIKLITGYIFDCILFPCVFFFLILNGIKGIFRSNTYLQISSPPSRDSQL